MSGSKENHTKTTGTIAGETAIPDGRTIKRSERVQAPKSWGGILTAPPPPPEPPSVREQMEDYLAFLLGVALAGAVLYYCQTEMGYHCAYAAMVGGLLGIALNLLLRYPMRFLLRALFWTFRASFIGGALAGVGWLVWKVAIVSGFSP